jgi:uncharacterized membrane protein
MYRSRTAGNTESYRSQPEQIVNDKKGDPMLLGLAGTGYGLIGILVIILLVVLIIYFVRRA